MAHGNSLERRKLAAELRAEGRKYCPRCDKVKTATEFHRSSTSKDGRYAYCGDCSRAGKTVSRHKPGNWERGRAAVKKWRQKYPARAALHNNGSRLKRKYGITAAEYWLMAEAQGHACKICGMVPKSALAVDHDHETKRVRGLLCKPCNRGIGMLQDSIEIVSAALKYLKRN